MRRARRVAMLTVVFGVFAGCLDFNGASAAESARQPHAVFVVGTLHYSPERSMPLLAGEVQRLGLRTTVILPEGDPERSKNGKDLPGLESLKDADVAIFFMRFLTLPDHQLQHILDYLESGRPIVGFRTSTHAFVYPEGHKHFRWNTDFGRLALGTKYIAHQSSETSIETVAAARKHPILAPVASTVFTSPGTLYLTSLQAGCRPLLIGTGTRPGDRLAIGGFGSFYIQAEEKDIVAWTWTNRWGARVFATSLGHVGDFGVEPAMRTMVNGIFWAAGQTVPSAKTKIHTFQIEPAPAASHTQKAKKGK